MPLAMFVSGAALVLLDQWSKRAVMLCVGNRCVAWGSLFRIRLVTNRQKIYRRSGARALLIIVWLTAAASGIILYHSGAWFQSPGARFGFGLALGGSAGNLLDILRHRCVIDFIDLGWWPVFNLADVGIIAGLIMALWLCG